MMKIIFMFLNPKLFENHPYILQPYTPESSVKMVVKMDVEFYSKFAVDIGRSLIGCVYRAVG